jgi:hypothetical protein
VVDRCRGVQDADRPASHVHGYARRRARPVRSILEERAGIQLLAAREPQRLTTANGRARLGVSTVQPGPFPSGPIATARFRWASLESASSSSTGTCGRLGPGCAGRSHTTRPRWRPSPAHGAGGHRSLDADLGAQLRLPFGGRQALSVGGAGQGLDDQNPQQDPSEQRQHGRLDQQFREPCGVLQARLSVRCTSRYTPTTMARRAHSRSVSRLRIENSRAWFTRSGSTGPGDVCRSSVRNGPPEDFPTEGLTGSVSR